MKALSAVVVLVVLAGGAVGAQDGGAASPSLLKATFGKLPIYFVENRSVYPEEVAYYIQGADKTLFFTRGGITFRLKGRDRDWVVKLEFVGANKEVVPRGEDIQQAVFSYFKGPEKDWKTGLKTYSRIVYQDLWPGIDLVYKAGVGQIKYEFVVAPGADPGKIRLRYHGVASLRTTDAGALRVETPEGSFEDAPPEAWQEIDGERLPVEMDYRLGNGEEFGFDLGDYDRARPLVLDPAVLVYCGYIGGAASDYVYAIAVDGAGSAYVTGDTDSSEQTFPATVGPDLTFNGRFDCDAFVAKVNPQGTGLVYCGYIGGADYDYAFGIAVDTAGNAYVTGSTRSDERTFPVMVGPDLTYNGLSDAFVAKVHANGKRLAYCGYVGGGYDESGRGIAVDAAGNAYVTGWTLSDENTFPVTVGPDPTFNGQLTDIDAFVAKVNAQGTALVYSGYVGGAAWDGGAGIAVDAAENAYVTGWTHSDENTFPVMVGPDLTYNGLSDAFVAKVNAAGTALVYCGYIGGAATDNGCGIAVDAARNAYMTGWTESDEKSFPVKVGPDLTFNGQVDAFVARVNTSGKAVDYCGYIGGRGGDSGFSIAVDGAGNAYVAGGTGSDEKTFPVKIGPDLTYNGGLCDAFVAQVNAQGTALVYSGYIGGAARDGSFGGIAVDAAGNAYVSGYTISDENTFPVAVGPDLTYNGSDETFVAKIALTLLEGSGAPRPGGTVNLLVTASDDAGLAYQIGTSLGTGPIPIDTRQIHLSADGLLMISVGSWWPTVFASYRGVIDSRGQAQAAIHIPNLSALLGIHLHTAFVTLDPKAPSGIKSISNTFSFPITK